MGNCHQSPSSDNVLTDDTVEEGGVFELHVAASRKHDGAVCSVCSADADFLMSGGMDGVVVSTRLNRSYDSCGVFIGHQKEVTQILYCSAISKAFSCSRDRSILMWSLSESQPVGRIEGAHDLVVSGITLDTDGRLLVSGSRDNFVKLWDVEKRVCVNKCWLAQNVVTSLKWLDGEHAFLQTSEDKMMKIWDVRSMSVVRTFPAKQYFQTCCDVDGNSVLTGSTGCSGAGCELTLWDVRKLQAVLHMRGHTERLTACKFFKLDNDECVRLVSVSHDSSVRIWDGISGDCLLSHCVLGAKELTSMATWKEGWLCVGTFQYGIHHYKFDPASNCLRHLAVF